MRSLMTRRVSLVISLALLSVTLTGCLGSLTTKDQTCEATKPVLAPTTNPDGGITLDRNDTAMLLLYIEDLERCSGVL